VLTMKSEITVIVKAWADRNAVEEYKTRVLPDEMRLKRSSSNTSGIPRSRSRERQTSSVNLKHCVRATISIGPDANDHPFRIASQA